MTFREFSALSERHKQQIQREDLRFGYLLAMTANLNRDSQKQPRAVQPWDFFSSLKPLERPPDSAAAWTMFARELATKQGRQEQQTE